MTGASINVTDALGGYNFASAIFWQTAVDRDHRFQRSISDYFDTTLAEVLDVFGSQGEVTFDGNQDGDVDTILSTETAQVLFCSRDDGWFRIQISADTAADADAWEAALLDFMPPVPEVEGLVPLTYWMNTSMGPRSFRRHVESQSWSTISGNYPTGVRNSVNRLATIDNFDEGGKIVLFHGHPGTGKTRALLGLVETWREWANVSIITDPDEFFGNSAYMLSVVMESHSDKWNILVVEDGDEFMDAADSGRKSQSVGRLLNLNDGFIGQGMKIATVISTNVNMESFNSAVTRPGRCLANIEFPKFTPDEASTWLAQHGMSTDQEMSLAEMYDHVRRTSAVRSTMARFDTA